MKQKREPLHLLRNIFDLESDAEAILGVADSDPRGLGLF